jgi:hypothetical protein
MEHENSLQCSQETATRPYPEPDQPSPHPQYHFINKTVPEKMATTCTEDGHKQNTKTSFTI